MIVSEITIGSYVRTDLEGIIKVESISTKRQHRKLGYHDTEDKDHIKYVRIGQVHPIKLTEDMLIKNNWHIQNTKDCAYWWHSNVPFGIPLRGFENEKDKMFANDFFEITLIRIESVHELQNMLRMCGLIEMAEKIKIV